MSVEDSKMIKVTSMPDEDGVAMTYELPYKAAELSEFLKDAAGDSIEEEEDDDDDDDNNNNKSNDKMVTVEVSRVRGKCLGKVVEFLCHYAEEPMKEIPTPLGGSSFNEVMDQEWYQTFVADDNLGQDMLFDMLTAANFMGIKELLDLTCLKVTFQLTGKSAEEIRQILRLPELTPEEEATARQEHRWIFED
eukprot:CAMPEP_0113482240 /NCGR_PEP_ID=MMETSP0014_2-20120614/22817_1 /TAXON_ID=2857 /ORGANISM="Nitzschia sp." /LENGTH=191 /DNA_ID=CAMNT_0000375751 /DNA_START=120 /DNA_END=695 /DNA_ORIENTATION=+ /assembly_acc=CAM_ASM_000159